MLNCQLPESVAGVSEPPLEELPPHAESTIVPASNKSKRLFTPAPQKRNDSGSRFAPQIARSLVNVSMTFHVLEA
jgi:hypothetical protein